MGTQPAQCEPSARWLTCSVAHELDGQVLRQSVLVQLIFPGRHQPGAQKRPCRRADHGSLKFSFKPLPPIAGPEDCTATHVVALDAVLSADGRRITLSPTAALRCPMAEAVTHWIREDVAPTTWLLQCRCTVLRLSIPLPAGGVTVSRMQRISKDGLANALDVRAFKLTNGAAI
jgi:hypothetical protein